MYIYIHWNIKAQNQIYIDLVNFVFFIHLKKKELLRAILLSKDHYENFIRTGYRPVDSWRSFRWYVNFAIWFLFITKFLN